MCRYMAGDVLKMRHLLNEKKKKMRKGVDWQSRKKMLKKDQQLDKE